MEFIKECDTDAHIEKDCRNRRVPCTNGCGKNIMFRLLQHHVWEVCSLRSKYCDYCKGELKRSFNFYIIWQFYTILHIDTAERTMYFYRSSSLTARGWLSVAYADS